MKMILMGTGTSHGVPVIACNCAVCRSNAPEDKRLRCSAFIKEPVNIVIDTGPEFRIQALKYKITHLDAVLLTHGHADHLDGLDDLRVFSHSRSADGSAKNPKGLETQGKGLSVYANNDAINDVKKRFDYVFKTVPLGGGKPKLDMEDCSSFTPGHPLKIGLLEILPVPLLHGTLPDSGWLISEYNKTDGKKHSIAYLTDLSSIPDSSIQLIQANAGILEHAVIDGLKLKPHVTHFSYEQAMALAEQIKPKHTWLTHLTHELSHKQVKEFTAAVLPNYPSLSKIVSKGGSVGPAYDGLELQA